MKKNKQQTRSYFKRDRIGKPKDLDCGRVLTVQVPSFSPTPVQPSSACWGRHFEVPPFWRATILRRCHFEAPPFWGAALHIKSHLGSRFLPSTGQLQRALPQRERLANGCSLPLTLLTHNTPIKQLVSIWDADINWRPTHTIPGHFPLYHLPIHPKCFIEALRTLNCSAWRSANISCSTLIAIWSTRTEKTGNSHCVYNTDVVGWPLNVKSTPNGSLHPASPVAASLVHAIRANGLWALLHVGAPAKPAEQMLPDLWRTLAGVQGGEALKVNLVYQLRVLTFYYLIIDSFFTR